MSRKAEFLAAIKPYVDKDSKREAKQDTIDLAKELSDVLSEINVKADGSDFEELKEAFNEQLTIMGKQPIVFSDNTLKGITAQFANAISEGIKAGMAEGSNEIKSLLKDGVAIKDAYENRNKLGRGSKTPIRQKFVRDVKEAFEYEPADNARGAGRNLATIKGQYEQATNWEDQYIALLKYIKAYEALERTTKDPTVLERWKTIGDYTIEQLKESKAAIQSSLQNIINVAYDKPLIGLTQDGTIDVNVDLKPLKTLDAYDVTDGKGEIEVPVKPKIKEYKVFRAVEDPSTSKSPQTKEDAIDSWGGEYWASDKDAAISYTANHWGKSSIINGIIRPMNPLIIDAHEKMWNDFENIPGLKELFPELINMMKQPDYIDDYGQKYINQQARLAGYDTVIFKNVQDNLDADTDDDAPITDTIAVLDDRIVSLTGSFAELEGQVDENGNKVFSKSRSDIPEYYTKSEELTPEQYLEQLRLQQQNSSQFFESKMPELEEVLKQKEEALILARKELEKDSKSYDKSVKLERAEEEFEYMKNFVQNFKNNFAQSQKNLNNEISYYQSLVDQKTPNKTRKSTANEDAAESARKAADEAEREAEAAERTYKQRELIGRLDKYTDPANIEEAKMMLAERKAAYEELQKEGMLTDEIKEKYNAVNKAIIEKFGLLKKETEEAGNSADAAERKAKAEREAANARRSELVKQLDEYGADTRNADQAQLNLDQREQIHKSLVNENLITDEIEEKYLAVNKRLEDRLALLKQVREHEHNINGVPGSGLITSENDPQVYYEEWFKPFESDVENIRKSGLFSAEEIEHYNIKLAEMQDYLQNIAKEALNNYLINPDEVNDAQKLNEILNQRQKILATVEQFDNPLDSPSLYEEALKLNQAIKDRIAFLQQPRSDTTGETEVAANQKKIESYEDLLAIVQKYYNLKSKLRSIKSDYPDGIDAEDYNPPIRSEMDSIEKLLESKQINKEVLSVYEALNSGYSVDEALQKIANALGIEIPQAARVAEGAVGDLNSELREGQSLMSQEPGSSALTGTGDASSEELKSLQDKNEQLRQEKESVEKDKKAANERANEAEAEAERLRNELANRDKADSEKPTSGTASINTSELESLLSRVTYKVKFEGESPLDNSAAVLETVKNALSNIQINASADKDAPWAREATLNGVIKNTLESIKSNTNSINEALKNVSIGPKSESKENDNIVVAKDSKNTKNKHGSISHGKADGESNSPQKILDYYYWLEEQMEQFKNNTMYFNALKETYDSITPKINKLIEDVLTEAEEKYGPDKNPPWLDSLIEKHGLHMAKIKGGEEYSDSISKEKKALDILSEEYRLKSEIFNLEQKGATQNDLASLYEKLGIYESIRSAIENSMDDGELTRYSVQAANVQNKGETKLTAAEIKANIKTRAEEAKKAAQSVKEEAAAVQELDELYQQLAQAKAMADAESDSVLRQPFEDRVSRLQSEIDAKEANIDRTKYSQQFDDTQKESYKKQIVEELIELYAKLGEAEAKEDRMSIGNATAQQNKSEMDALYKRIAATQKLIDVNEELQNQFDAARKAASDKVVAKADKADAVSDDKSFEKLGKQYEKLGKLRAQVQSTGSAVIQEDARQLEEAIKKEQERLGLSKEQTEELERRLEIARKNELLRQNSIKQQKSFEQQIKDSRNQARLNTANSTIRTAEDINRNAMMIDGVSPESLSKMKELDRATESLKQKCAEINAKGGIVSDDDQKDVINQIANVKRLSSEVNELVKEYNNLSDDNVKTIGNFNGQLNGASIDEYKRQLKEAVVAATKGKASIKGFDAETKTLSYTVKTGSHEFTNYTAAVRGFDKALVSTQKETKRTETFIESITRKTKEIGTYLISSLSLYDVINKFRQGIQYVREIDSALVELRKVTDETEESYDRFLQTASKTGAKIGSTISDYTRATATFAKLGYSIDMASEMAEAAIIYQNVGDGIESADAAAESIISTMKGFGLQASDAMSIVDKFNQVGNEFSITSKGIGDALQRSASALAEGNNTLDESIGLITAANSVVQDPETVGKAMCRR